MLIKLTPDIDYQSLSESPSPEEFFLLSRLKGELSLKQLCAASGLEKSKALKAIARLLEFGLLSSPSYTPPVQSPPSAPSPPSPPSANEFKAKLLTDAVALPSMANSHISDVETQTQIGVEGSFSSVFDEPGKGISGERTQADPAATRPAVQETPTEAFNESPERVSIQNRSIESLFADEDYQPTEEISIGLNDVGSVSMALLSGTNASTSKVIEISDEGEFDDDSDIFGGDDEPLGDDPRLSSFMDDIIPQADEDLFNENSIAHHSRVVRAVPKIRDTRPRSAQLGVMDGKSKVGFQAGLPPKTGKIWKVDEGPDYNGIIASFESFTSPFPPYEGVSPELQKEIDFVFQNLSNISYYQLFNMKRDAERKEIRKAYFIFSKRFHPDIFFGEAETELSERCGKVFKFVAKAYSTLGKKKKRIAYDIALDAHLEFARQREKTGHIKRLNAQSKLLLRVEEFESQGDFTNAITEMRRVVSLDPNAVILLRAANLHLKANAKLSDAATYVRLVLKEDKKNIQALVLLGRIYEQNEMLMDAQKLYQRAMEISPHDAALKIHLERVISNQEKRNI